MKYGWIAKVQRRLRIEGGGVWTGDEVEIEAVRMLWRRVSACVSELTSVSLISARLAAGKYRVSLRGRSCSVRGVDRGGALREGMAVSLLRELAVALRRCLRRWAVSKASFLL